MEDFLQPDNERPLLENNLSERCIAHKLAEYLKGEFADFDVDCEYNRNIDVEKTLRIEKEKLIEIAWDKIKDDDTYSVFPDIVIHTRKYHQNNHILIEIKKRIGSKKDKNFDFEKLQAFTSPNEDYKYKLGIYLEFNTKKDVGISPVSRIIYFQNGKGVETNNDLVDWE